MRPLVRPPVICGILLPIETCSVRPARILRAWRGASMWRTTSRTSTPSPTCRSQLECATTSPACRSRSRPTPSRTSWTTRPVVPGLCFPCSALSCGSRRCGFHRRTSICVETPVARLRCASSRALHAQVVQEVADALTTTRAVARLHGKTTSFVGGVVASVGTLRLLCFLAMQAFRLAVASLLCYGGAYFIGHTIALSDLILNCIALEVRSSFRHATCVGVVGNLLPGGMCPLFTISIRGLCVWPCAPLVPRTRLRRALPIRGACQ